MGNCVHRQQEVDESGGNEQEREMGKAGEPRKENTSKESSGMRIKVMLTKEELELLLFQLKNEEGQRLEDLLEEIERGRRRTLGWKPSLESITESPEMPDQMDR